MNKDKDKALSPLGAEMVAGLSEFCESLESGAAIAERFTVRTVSLDLQTKEYGPEDVKDVRKTLKASQALLARFLGVSVKAVSSWEQGRRPVPKMACRYLDDIVRFPELWRERLRMTGEPTDSSCR
jgi:DNA-binding transcriptional regulator YiaG